MDYHAVVELDTDTRLRAIEGDDDELICPICKKVLWHKSIEYGSPECYYCPTDRVAFSADFPYQEIGVID
jgi:hypothetical protein